MLPESTERILASLGDDDLVLDVGAWGAPFNRATHVLDVMPYETRGVMGSYGPPPERFSEDTWVIRDFCDREPWPWPDDHFEMALCVTTLEDIRDPIWVCSEMSRVARRGYVEVPSVLFELAYGVQGRFLGYEHHRWLVDVEDGGLVFMHKPHSIHDDWRVRVLPRWADEMPMEEKLQGLFWEGSLPARERVEIGLYPLDELAERVRKRFQPSEQELRIKRARAGLREAWGRYGKPLRRGAGVAMERLRRRAGPRA